MCVGTAQKGPEGVERSSLTKTPQSRENVPARRAQLRLPSFVVVVVVVL